jgi:ATP-dependent phosphofructokinase / diphosphate-dependent phosphofructokinase
MTGVTRLAVLTGGGDAPGLNAVIRAVVKASANSGIECVGVEDGFDGFVTPGRLRSLRPCDVTGILRRGGTILGTTSRGNPFARGAPGSRDATEYADRVMATFREAGLDALVVIGGDGTLAIAHELSSRGLPLVGVPKTIDNDIVGTASSFGFDSAVAFATDAIDRLHTTAEAHKRVLVVEVMGRYAGWIALHAGVGGGADAVLIPEIPFDLSIVCERIARRDRWGARFSIVVVAEGASAVGGKRRVLEEAHDGRPERVGGVGAWVANELPTRTGKETRSVVLGHLQRGGAPTNVDRLLATRFGDKAVELVKAGQFGTMVALEPPAIVTRRLCEVVGQIKKCRSIPTCSRRRGRSA